LLDVLRERLEADAGATIVHVHLVLDGIKRPAGRPRVLVQLRAVPLRAAVTRPDAIVEHRRPHRHGIACVDGGL
jgi:hypothetical protein